MATLAEFRAAFPEFSRASDALVNAKLTDASGTMDVTVWGDRYDQGQLYLAAHLLALAPGGQSMRLKTGEMTSVYWSRYKSLLRIVTAGYRLV